MPNDTKLRMGWQMDGGFQVFERFRVGYVTGKAQGWMGHDPCFDGSEPRIGRQERSDARAKLFCRLFPAPLSAAWSI